MSVVFTRTGLEPLSRPREAAAVTQLDNKSNGFKNEGDDFAILYTITAENVTIRLREAAGKRPRRHLNQTMLSSVRWPF